MRTGRGLRTICLPILLAALAAQGISPDPNDLASPVLLRVVGSIWQGSLGHPGYEVRVDSIALGGDPPRSEADPVPWEDRDSGEETSPDEICVPCGFCGGVLSRQQLNKARHAPYLAFGPGERFRRPGPPRPFPPRGDGFRVVDLVLPLCRLTC